MNRIDEFAESFIPKNLPKKRHRQLKDEIMCHLLDKVDFYKEIGYEEKISIDKAIKEFGEDEGMKAHIRSEFEELYSEKTIWGILAGLFIWGMNIMCFPLDLWSCSADFNRDPDPLGAFLSFLMIFSVLAFVVFARIKKYRKMLLFIGLANMAVVCSLLWNFYPQMAMISVWYNMIYLFERFTPFLIHDTIAEYICYYICYYGVSIALAIYPVTASVLLKLGKLKSVKNPSKKSITVASVCFCIMFTTCMLQQTGLEYYEEYPVFFSPYDMYISPETEDIYNRISIGDSVEYAESVMEEYAVLPVEKYREEHLDRLGKKQFDAKLKTMNFSDKYTVYFPPYSYIAGEGFVGIESENGIVTGIAIGNIDGAMYNEKSETFGYTSTRKCKTYNEMNGVLEYINSLQPGASESDILQVFCDDTGFLDAYKGLVYSKRKHIENGELKTYYRVYFYGVTDREKHVSYERHSPFYLELYFTEGILQKGTLYSREYTTDDGYTPKKLMTIA